MKPNKLIPLILLAGCAAGRAATLAEVATKGDTIGTTYLFDGNAGVGGGDFDTTGIPETGIFNRTWLVASPGGTGVDISVTGLAFGLPGGGHTDGNVITATITYLGADGLAGGTDDVVLGSTKATLTNFATTLAGRYEWLFDAPITGNIDGAASVFAVKLESLEADNGGNTLNMRFKTTSGTVASAVKIDIAGTSASSGLFTDNDGDGLNDAFETNTGIFVGPTNTGTDPAKGDTDDDGLLDGVENNSRSWISAGRTGTSPLDPDSDNDGLLDGVETKTGLLTGVSDTGTHPLNRDTDNDRLSDKFELDNGLDLFTNADFDSDGAKDALEVLFYGSDPKVGTSFPGDGNHPAAGSFTPIQDAGVINNVDLDIPSTLGSTIINEAGVGGNVDADFVSGVTSFALHFANAFPAAGSTVSITGFAWPVVSAINAGGDILLQFFDPGADGVVDGIDKDTLVGTARGTLSVTGANTLMYWNFAPVNFTSSGTGLVVKIQSTAALRIKAQDNLASGVWRTNDGYSTFGNLRSSRVSIGGTVIAPPRPKILSITRTGTSTSVTWELNGVPAVDLERSTDLGDKDPWTKVLTNTSNTSYNEISPDPKAFFRLAVP